MANADLKIILEQVRAGKLSIEQALENAMVSQVGAPVIARLDLDRKRRCGFPEVILAEGKTVEWLTGVVNNLVESGQDTFVTRLGKEQTEKLQQLYPKGEFDLIGRTCLIKNSPSTALSGYVPVLTAGTGDLPVAYEAVSTIQALGVQSKLIADVGVAGLHRLLGQQENFLNADAIVVAAGMDGALPSVVGGLVDCPVIAVPTSIGYGTAFNGLAPLLTMLNACSANVTVVNIDAGFKAGYCAALISKRLSRERI